MYRLRYHVFNQNIKVLSSEVQILFAKVTVTIVRNSFNKDISNEIQKKKTCLVYRPDI